ncbi:MAG: response regulator transcription factor [Clostridiales bacterium]|nr:response regulator transcription factor [Clostridiales bacterium]
MKTKILTVDDDMHITELIALYLKREGYEVKEVHSGKAAIAEFTVFAPHLVILDVMLPEADGYEVLREIRRVSSVPVILLTAKGETFDKVLGLELGADDYVVKPFEAKELVARVKAVLRRFVGTKETDVSKQIVYPNLTINPSTYNVIYRGEVLEFPPKEFELIYFLASHPNQVFTRDQLLDHIWGYEFVGDTRTVDVHIKRIREKFQKEGDNWSVKTIWGVGYKFESM